MYGRRTTGRGKKRQSPVPEVRDSNYSLRDGQKQLPVVLSSRLLDTNGTALEQSIEYSEEVRPDEAPCN